MAEDLIDTYVTELREHLPMTGPYLTRVLEETRDHLEHQRAELQTSGMTADSATAKAIAALGPVTEYAQRFNAAATSRTRLLAALAGCGALAWLGTIRLANTLHAEGERFGADLRYSMVWAVGLLSAAAVIGLLLAVVLRLGARRPEVKAAALTVVLAFVGLGGFHLANDGTLERGPGPDAWRLAALGAFVAGSALLLIAFRRMGHRLDRATWLTTSATVLLVFHYTVFDERGPLALIAVATLAFGCVWVVGALVRERHLA